MANFFTDNDDIQFLLDHMDLARLAEIMEDGLSLIHISEPTRPY